LSPAEISLGENLGKRASLSLTFADGISDDAGIGFDKYLSDRSYLDPTTRGSFWGKFRARQPYLRGKELRLIQGTSDDSYEDMESRTFIIENFDGPSDDGSFSITAKDILKLTDGDRSVVPAISTGYLSGAITSGATSATLAPSGIGDLEYPSSGYIAIGGKEIVSFTRSSDTLTITRAQHNTDAVAHDAGDRAQICQEYSAQSPAYVVNDLLVNGAGVDSSEIPYEDWLLEATAYYGRVVTALIPEPTPVKQLIGELMEQCGMAHMIVTGKPLHH
jgi:hypothetical protein